MTSTTRPSPRNPQTAILIGAAVALALHTAIVLLLSVQWTAGERRFDNPPMEVDLIAEVAPQSSAPVIAPTPPAAKLGEVDDVQPEPQPSPPVPVARAKPTPMAVTPVPAKKPPLKTPPAARVPAVKAPPAKSPPSTASKSPPAKSPPAKRPPAQATGRLDGIVDGLSRKPPKAPASVGAPAATIAAEVKKSIDVSIKAAIAPKWNKCRVDGVDIEQLKTVVRFRLTLAGGLAGFTSVTTSGQNDSNRFQVQRHQECAKRAIELAAPFDLPEANFGVWQNYTLDFVKR